MRVLVIGANGSLGRACVSALHNAQHHIVAIVRSAASFPPKFSQACASVIEADARNPQEIINVLRAHRCNGIIQAGGYTPFWPWQKTDLPLIFTGALDAAEEVARERSGTEDGAIAPECRIRTWMISDFGMMDSPWDDTLLWH
jgi:nucleoside-diphosphate-sugar epimerase